MACLLVHGYGGADGYLISQFNAGGVDMWKVPVVQALLKSREGKRVVPIDIRTKRPSGPSLPRTTTEEVPTALGDC
jgi:hypothetical protein